MGQHASSGTTRGANLDAIAAATGRGWEEWTAWLDGHGARGLPDHGAIAALALDRLREPGAPGVENPEWWAQGVTVAYEQHIGRRVPGQRADGTFDASATRTVAGAHDDVHARAVAAFEARIAEGDGRLGGIEVVGTPTRGRSTRRPAWRARLADGSRLEVTAEAKGAGRGTEPRTLVAVTLSRVADGATVPAWKALWKELLGRL